MSDQLHHVAYSMTIDDVSLAPFDPEHVSPAYMRWINDPDVMRHTEARWVLHTREGAAAYVRRSNDSAESQLFRILLAEQHVGNLRLSAITYQHCRAEVALIIGEASARGRGVGRRAIEIACAHGFVTLSLTKLAAGFYANNEASIKAFEAAGFAKVAQLTRHYRSNGGWVNGVIMERLSPL
ncbi:MAG: GNAT family protein [Alphaproteobacteria bacterium]|nr:GNAT family protein [Alphaproteobacteria bacterium]